MSGFDNEICNANGYRGARRSIASSDSITRDDFYIGCNHNVAITLDLPTNPGESQMFIIKDESGSASSYPITIQVSGGAIDGQSSFIINVDYGAINLMSNGLEYYIF